MTVRAVGDAGDVRIRLLGPVEVEAGGECRPVRGARRGAVLAALALRPGEVVGVDQLVESVWGDGRQPDAARATLHSHVSYLRGVLGDRHAIAGRQPGYLLNLADGVTDAQAAERLIDDGARSADPEHAAGQLQAAVALWRGEPLAELAGLAWFDGHVRRLDLLLLRAQELLAAARLALGQHAQLIPQLESLTRQHPFHEQLWGQLMVALYRTGRQGDALATYQRARQLLRDELGVDPGGPLRDLHSAVLRHDAELAAPAPRPASGTGRAASRVPAGIPAQLPLAVASFTGRRAELDALDRLVPDDRVAPGEDARPAVAVCVLSGSPGVGKTSLAVYWAHRVAQRFPDGQLYVNLRGFDPGGSVLDPADALHGFLQALGVPPDRMPAGLEARAALYRSLLAGRRVLVVLDNAREPEQVRPLLPGTPGCLAVVASRRQLASLMVVEGAHPLFVDLMPVTEARDMMAGRLGEGRTRAEPHAVQEIITRCARLPLALAIASARAAARPGLPLSELAAALRDARPGLDALAADDPASDVRAVFSWSYRALNADAAQLFRLLSEHPGPDITAPVAASLTGLPLPQARRLLADLASAHLLAEQAPGRYAFHDLMRAYAREQSSRHDGDEQRHAASLRMLDHLLHTAHAGAVLLAANRGSLLLAPPAAGAVAEVLTSDEQALAWLSAERQVLVAAVGQAARTGFNGHAWQLAWTLTTILLRQGRSDEHVRVQQTALAAPGRLARPGYARSGQFDKAHPYLLRARDLYARTGDQASQARACGALAWAAQERGNLHEALALQQQILDLCCAAGNEMGQARFS
jgi:DNA-binding SARP family transcriptional activator